MHVVVGAGAGVGARAGHGGKGRDKGRGRGRTWKMLLHLVASSLQAAPHGSYTEGLYAGIAQAHEPQDQRQPAEAVLSAVPCSRVRGMTRP